MQYQEFGSLILWIFLPGWITSFLLKILHAIASFFLRRPSPPVGSKTYQRHYRWLFTAVVTAYLLSGIYGVLQNQRDSSSHYQRFGVRPGADFDTNALRSSFRKFSRMYHPDKNGGEDAQAQFVRIRTAFETLNDPRKRFLYDRFGAGSLDCSYCKTQNDYFYFGLVQQMAFYVGTGMVFGLLYWTGGQSASDQFWKYWAFFAMFAVELSLLTRSDEDVTSWLPQKTAAEKIELLHHVFLARLMAFSQLAPLFVPKANTSDQASKMMDQMEALQEVMKREFQFNAHLCLEPFLGEEASRTRMQQSMEKIAVDLRLFDEYKEYSDVFMKVKSKIKQA